MSKIMYNQKWAQINEYPLDYFELLYQYYSTAGVRVPVTYYNLDLPNSVHDSDTLMGGSYETMGNLSGYLWKKILMLHVYNLEQINFTLNADESGVGFHNKMTSLFIPTTYEFLPAIHDFMIYDQIQWRSDPFRDEIPMYEVVNLEKASSAQISFWKLTLKGSSRTKHEIEKQLSGNFTFVDYEKKIYRTSDAIYLAKQMEKNSNLAVNGFFKEQIGLYVENKEQN